MNRITRQKVTEEAEDLNTIDQLDLSIYIIPHPATADYTFFSSAHGTFFSIDHVLDHKTSLNKFKSYKVSSLTKVG